MYANVFDPIAFIFEGSAYPLPDMHGERYLYSANGVPEFASRPKGTPIELAPENPDLALGNCYTGITHKPKMIPDDPPYEITSFDFHQHEVGYQALRAFRDTALRLRQTGDVCEDRLVADRSLRGACLAGRQDSGRVVAGLPFVAVGLVGLRSVSLDVLSVLAGMTVACFVDECQPDRYSLSQIQI